MMTGNADRADGAETAVADSGRTEHAPRSIPISSVDIGAAERRYVEAAIASGWISGTGPYVSKFERGLANRIDRTHVVATANGTLAIELALRALGIGPGDEVIVPALTFAAPASSVLSVGALPVLADVTPTTWTLCADSVAARITRRTKAILAVDILGHPCDYDELLQFGIPVIEDAAEAHDARYKGHPVGSLGIISIFSFFANKSITTGEGGCAATDSAELADRMRVIVNHGMRPERPYVHYLVGRNYRMTNLAAAVGLGQLDRWDELIGARNKLSAAYSMLLADAECATRPVAEWADYSCWMHTITVRRRDNVLAGLRDSGIDARAIWPPLSAQSLFNPGGTSSPVAEDIAGHAILLPTFSGMTDSDTRCVADAVRRAIAQAR